MPQLRLFDTALGRVVEIEQQPEQSMYVCGITPYDATHMGHAASYVAFDLLNRARRDAGIRVAYVQNVTDIDDPLLERATATGVDWRELAQSQIELFHTDMDALNVLAPNHYIGAVEAIPDIVPAIERLIADGVAYRVLGTDGEPDGDVYYDVEMAGKRSDATDAWTTGDVSGLGEAEMLALFAERGGDPDRAGKRQALDPLLWRVAREGEPSWPGPLSAMAVPVGTSSVRLSRRSTCPHLSPCRAAAPTSCSRTTKWELDMLTHWRAFHLPGTMPTLAW